MPGSSIAEILLLDEPFAALDPVSRESLLRDFQRIVRESKITTVLVTHHREEAFGLGLASTVGVLHRRRLLQLGAREEVFHQPATETVAEIVGIENRLPGVVEDCEGQLANIRINQNTFTVAGRFQPGAKVIACLRPEDIVIGRENDRAENCNWVKGRITGIAAGVIDQRMSLDCDGMLLVALIRGNDCLGERLSENAMVTAMFSFTAPHVIPNP
jgi:ABC-type Fe3+/spermidine/putrescine transport system ATPase subunit